MSSPIPPPCHVVCPEFYAAVVRAVANRETKVDTREDLAGFPRPNGHQGLRNEPAMREIMDKGVRRGEEEGAKRARDIFHEISIRTVGEGLEPWLGRSRGGPRWK